MQQPHGSTLRVVRLPAGDTGYNLFAIGRQVVLARAHPLLPGHVGLVDAQGIYRVVKLGEGGSRASVVAVYELQLCADAGFVQPLHKEWCDFQHLPDDGLLLCQQSSARILFAQLPQCEGERGPVFLFGSHDGAVHCLAANRELLLSGGADGCVRLWGLDSGSIMDCCRRQGAIGGHVTAVAFAGPLLVASGTDQGTVCMYDISTSRLVVVQRFTAGEGPITALASRLTPRQVYDVITAAAPRGPDGGGVLAAPVGLPWRSSPGFGAVSDGCGGTDTLLAVASPAGWVKVFRAARSGEDAWQLVHHCTVDGPPYLSYSPDGNYLAVGAGDRLEVLNATSFELVHLQLFQRGPLSGAGFLAAAAGGSALVAMQVGGTLVGGMRLRVFAAPAGQEPELMQLTLPLREVESEGLERRPEVNQDEDSPDWLQRAVIHDHTSSGSRSGAASASASAMAIASTLLRGLSLGSHSPTAAVTNALAAADVRRGGATDGSGQPPQALSAAPPSSPSSRRNLAWGVSGGDPSAGISPGLPGANPAWGWQAFAPSPSASSESPGSGGQNGVAAAESIPGGGGAKFAKYSPSSAEPLASPWWRSGGAAAATKSSPQHRLGSWFRSPPKSPAAETARGGAGTHGAVRGPGGGGAGDAASAAAAAHSWQAYRPATQPAPRSWITGQPPRADFLPQPTSPPSSSSSPPRPQPTAAAGAPQGSPVKASAPAAGAAATVVASPTTGCSRAAAAAAAVSRPVSNGRSNLQTFAAERTGGRGEEGQEAEREAGGLCVVSKHEPESELPCSATLLPATAGRTAVTAPPSSGLSLWREGDLDLGPEGSSASCAGAAEFLEATFRFQQPQHPDDRYYHHHYLQQEQQQRHHQLERDLQEQSLQGPSDSKVTAAAEGASSPSPHGATRMTYGATNTAAAAAADWAAGDGNPDPLDRTAFFGGALVAALKDLPDESQEYPAAAATATAMASYGHGQRLSSPRSGWDRSDCRARAEDRALRGGGGESEEEGVLRGEGFERGERRGGEAAGGAAAPGAGQEAAAKESKEDDPDDLVPRGASGLPTPQPEWSQERLRLHRRLFKIEQSEQEAGRRQAQEEVEEEVEEEVVESDSAGALATVPTLDVEPYSPSCHPQPTPFTMKSRAEDISAPESQAPAASRPASSSFRGFKPNHSKAMQQLRKAAPAPAGRATAVAGGLRQVHHRRRRYDADDVSNEAVTPANYIMPNSASVLLGSPRDSAAVTDAKSSRSTTAAAAVPDGAGPRRPQQRTSGTSGRGGGGATTTAGGGGGGSSGLQQLQYLRQLRHSRYRHQLLLRRDRQAVTGPLGDAATAGPTRDMPDAAASSSGQSGRSRSDSARMCRPAGGNNNSDFSDLSTAMDSFPTLPWQARARPQTLGGLGDHPEAEEGDDDSLRRSGTQYAAAGSSLLDCAMEQEAEGPDGYSPLGVPQLGSTRLILRKMEALTQDLVAPVTRAASRGAGRRRRGFGGGLQGREEGGKAKAVGGVVNEAAWEEAARRAATSTANVPPARQLYRNLPALDEAEGAKLQPARAVKHLHPGWVASRLVKPELETLWRPSEHAHEVCTTRGVATYLPPSAAEVAISGLAAQWLC